MEESPAVEPPATPSPGAALSAAQAFADAMLGPLARPIESVELQLQSLRAKQERLTRLIEEQRLADGSVLNLEYVEGVVSQLPAYERKVRHILEVMNRAIYELENLKLKSSMLRERAAAAAQDPASQERVKSLIKGRDSLKERGTAMISRIQEGLKN